MLIMQSMSHNIVNSCRLFHSIIICNMKSIPCSKLKILEFAKKVPGHAQILKVSLSWEPIFLHLKSRTDGQTDEQQQIDRTNLKVGRSNKQFDNDSRMNGYQAPPNTTRPQNQLRGWSDPLTMFFKNAKRSHFP